MPEKIAIQSKAGLLTYLYRFGTGLHMDGVERMKTSWTRRGTEPAHRDNWWNRKARLGRAAWRWGCLSVAVTIIYGVTVAPTVTLVTCILAALYLAFKVGFRIHDRVFVRVRVGYGDYTQDEKMIHHHVYRRWQKIRDIFIRSRQDDSLPPDVLKHIQADNAEEKGAPIIEAHLVPGKRQK